LNRPEALNALNTALKDDLLGAVTDVAGDTSVRALVLTGAGRAFCAGQDLVEHQQTLKNGESLHTVVTKHYNPIVLALATMPKPVIAAVNGTAAGAGAGLAFACDLRLASSSASFLLAFARIGLTIDSGVSWTLPRLIGSARASALSLLAEPVSAESALEMGMVNAVVEPDHLLPAALELATRLADGPTVAYGAIKESLVFSASASLADALDKEADLQATIGRTEDHQAAVEAFVAKTSTTFHGR
jgi:2-(1,2-epoxy-1,2-dihydrophenyl)acetyl-CoA isomerase